MPFPAPLDLRHMPGSYYLTLNPFPYVGVRDAWVIEAGFRTDLTSRPKPFGWLIDVGGDHAPASVLHDYHRRHPELINASDADGVFRRVLGELGESSPRRWLMWAAVRVSCRMKDATGQDWYYVLLLTVPAVLFLLLPLLVVLVFGGAFRLLERFWP